MKLKLFYPNFILKFVTNLFCLSINPIVDFVFLLKSLLLGIQKTKITDMKKIVLLLVAFLVFQSASAQDDTNSQTTTEETQPELIDYDTYFIDHKTTMGERMIMISKKYMVDPDEIYKYNEVQTDGLGLVPGQVLKIPLHESHKQDLEKFKHDLIKKNGGNPIQVPAVPPLKKKTEDEEEDE
ncbi:MAG: hypothetical protein DI539_08985 [Flavobacterium psychrophilum]|nr:MAG: hypothetical protein DI539_08985 [Flavobacterium psychrophilum]